MTIIDSVKSYYSWFGVGGLASAIMAKLTSSNLLIRVKMPEILFPFYLRCRTSDIQTFEQVFIKQDYDFEVVKYPKVIVDAGANIGLASIYFTNRYSDSQIIAIEPEMSNYEMLKKNVTPYNNVIPLNAALWDKNEEVNVVDPGFGKWAFMTQGENCQEESLGIMCHKVRGMTVGKIMEDNGLEKIDILKIDIEGAEREVFRDASSWVGRVDAMIVELHDSRKPGCNSSFIDGSKGFDVKWKQGENIYLSRRDFLRRSLTQY